MKLTLELTADNAAFDDEGPATENEYYKFHIRATEYRRRPNKEDYSRVLSTRFNQEVRTYMPWEAVALPRGPSARVVDPPTTLEELLAALKADAVWKGAPMSNHEPGVDWSSLPTFGGEPPADTAEVLSWDADRLLVGTDVDNLTIEDRS